MFKTFFVLGTAASLIISSFIPAPAITAPPAATAEKYPSPYSELGDGTVVASTTQEDIALLEGAAPLGLVSPLAALANTVRAFTVSSSEPTSTTSSTPLKATPVLAIVQDMRSSSTSYAFTGSYTVTTTQATTGTYYTEFKRKKPGQTSWERLQTVTTTFTAETKKTGGFTAPAVSDVTAGTVQYQAVTYPQGRPDLATFSNILTQDYTRSNVTLTQTDFTGTKAVKGYSGVTLKATFAATSVKSNLRVSVQYREVGTSTWLPGTTYTVTPATPRFSTLVSWSIPKARDYRFVTAADWQRNAFTSGIVRVNKELGDQPLTVYTNTLQSRVVPWQQQSIKAYNGYKATKVLQEKRGTVWYDITVMKDVAGTHEFKLPVGSKTTSNATKTYRVKTLAAGPINWKISAWFNVKWENPNLYTSSKKTLYNYYKSYCPNVLLDVKPLSGNLYGLAYMGQNRMEIHSGTPYKHWRTTVLHECAHHRQWDLHKSKWAWFTGEMNRIHRTSGVGGYERNAHCIAHRWASASFWVYGATSTNCVTGQPGHASWRLSKGYAWYGDVK